MKYKAIPLNNGGAFLVSIPEYPTETPMDIRDSVILELYERLEALQTDQSPIQGDKE